jgi:hypothetical protein
MVSAVAVVREGVTPAETAIDGETDPLQSISAAPPPVLPQVIKVAGLVPATVHAPNVIAA